MDRSVKIQKITTPAKGRTIVISDIHANLTLYKKLLVKVNYRPHYDRLILNGDLIEKGHENLSLLHRIMKQVETEDVYATMGNCDFICKNVLYSYRLEFLKKVLLLRKESLLHEMCNEIGLTLDEHTDMEIFCQTLRKHFLKELSFCNDLPHVIETEDTIYAHSALRSPENYGDDFREVINCHLFLKNNTNYFPKKVIVGHMPVTEYATKIANYNSFYDSSMNVYSIDGGNIVKENGQLNALIFDQNHIENVAVDELPTATVLQDVTPGMQMPLYVNWNEGEIQILKHEKTQSYVFSEHLNRKFWVENEFIHDHKATGYTNYEMPLKKGETVQVCFTYQNKVQIKKNGILGWTYRQNIDW